MFFDCGVLTCYIPFMIRGLQEISLLGQINTLSNKALLQFRLSVLLYCVVLEITRFL